MAISGKVAGFGISLIVLTIGLIILVRFGSSLKIGERLNEGLASVSGGFNSFFDSLLPSSFGSGSSAADSIRVGDPNDPFFSDGQKSIGSPQDAISDLDPKSPTFNQDAKKILEDEFGITGADKITVLPNGGLKIESVGKPQATPKGFDLGFNLFPNANAETVPAVQGPIQALSDKELTSRASLTNFVTSQPLPTTPSQQTNPTQSTAKTGNQSINVKGEVAGVEIFGGFASDPNTFGVIRPTPPDRSKLLLDANKQPIETASERANRVFLETGQFADAKTGSIPSAFESSFDFGTNDGSGLKGSSPAEIAKSKQDALAREAEKARKIFDSRSISNF